MLTAKQREAARLLRRYPYNCLRYKERLQYLESGAGKTLSNERVKNGTAFPTSPQESTIIRIENDKQLKHLLAEIEPVEAACKLMSSAGLSLIRLRYWAGEPWRVVAEELGMSFSYVRGAFNSAILNRFTLD